MPEFDFTTLFFAVVAIAVAFRLYRMLGTHTPSDLEDGRPVANLRRAPAPAPVTSPPAAPDRPDDSRWKGAAKAGSPAENGLAAIGEADPSFDARAFLEGARAAYSLIVQAFAAGDSAALRPLLASDVYAQFSEAILDRTARRRTQTVSFVGALQSEIDSASIVGTEAHIVVRFAAKLLSATRDAAGAVVEGSADAPEDHVDLWTFARDPKSANPNWTLLATQAVVAP
jgi:predicted lipid-binding transport protein (Tim44 family)